MADNQGVVTTDDGFEPEPIPDNIADTALDGLNPADESTDSEQVETDPEDTEQDQDTDDSSDDEQEDTDDSGNPDEQEDANADDDGQEQEQPTNQQDAAREAFKQREANRKQRDYVTEQRQQIREYEQNADMTDTNERMRVLEAKQYVDTVERNRASLINDNLAAQASIPMFNPNDKAFNERAYAAAVQSFNDNYVVTDPQTGEVLGAVDREGNNVSLRSYLQQQANLYEELVNSTQRQTQKSEVKMRAKAVNPSNPGKVTSSGNELDDLLDKIGDIPLN